MIADFVDWLLGPRCQVDGCRLRVFRVDYLDHFTRYHYRPQETP